ncbi:MAG: hypothetical protein ACHQF2_10850 [Flavobacteriales bacterium]
MKLVYRFLGPILLFFTLVMAIWGLCFAMEWVGIDRVISFIGSMFGWFGVYFFYITRPQSENTGVLQRVVHIISIPLAVLGYLTFKGSLDPADFWPTLNMAMLAVASYGVIVLTKSSAQSYYIKLFMALYVVAMLVLTLLHMQGYFENGKLLSMMVFAGFGIQVAMVMLSRKPVEPQ